MSQMFGAFLIFVIFYGPIPFAIGLFFLAHWLEKRFARLGKRISLSLWTGVLGLLPGLANSEITNFGGGFINLGRNPDQGWPFYWVGADGLGLIGVPAAILGDILVVAGVAFVGFSLLSLLNPILNFYTKLKIGLYIFLIFLFAMLPIWVNLSKIVDNLKTLNTITNTSLEMTDEQFHRWVKKVAKPTMNSIRLEKCTGFQLIPSQEHPGRMNIQLTVETTYTKPENFNIMHYMIQANMLDDLGNPVGDRGRVPIESGNELKFLFYPMGRDVFVNVDRPGPYKVLVTVDTILITDPIGQIFDQDAIQYAHDTLGISDQNLKLECWTPPYTFEDLGESVP